MPHRSIHALPSPSLPEAAAAPAPAPAAAGTARVWLAPAREQRERLAWLSGHWGVPEATLLGALLVAGLSGQAAVPGAARWLPLGRTLADGSYALQLPPRVGLLLLQASELNGEPAARHAERLAGALLAGHVDTHRIDLSAAEPVAAPQRAADASVRLQLQPAVASRLAAVAQGCGWPPEMVVRCLLERHVWGLVRQAQGGHAGARLLLGLREAPPVEAAPALLVVRVPASLRARLDHLAYVHRLPTPEYCRRVLAQLA